MLKRLYQQILSERFREKLSPVLQKIWRSWCRFLGKNPTREGIGIVRKISRRSRVYLKVSFAQQGEDLIVDRILQRILGRKLSNPGVYVDVGAYHPIEHSVTYLLYLRGWKGIAIDASSTTQNEFLKYRNKDDFFNCVVGGKDNLDVDFYVSEGVEGDRSLINTKYPDNDDRYRKVTLKQRSINSILDDKNITKINVLNIDIEGAELEVLESLDFDKFRPDIVAVEIHGNDIEVCLQSPVAELLFSRGYKCVATAVITYFFVLRGN